MHQWIKNNTVYIQYMNRKLSWPLSGSKFNLVEGDSSSVTNETQPMEKSVKSKLYKLQPCVESTSVSDCSTLKLNSSSPVKNSLMLQIHTTSQRQPEFKPETNSTSQHRAQLLPLQQGAPEHLPLTDRSARGTEEGKERKNSVGGEVWDGERGLVQSEIEGERYWCIKNTND